MLTAPHSYLAVQTIERRIEARLLVKAIKVSGGFVVKRKARIEHWCKHCRCAIEPGEEYYEFKVEHSRHGYITKRICEDCWHGRELEA